MVGIAQQAQFFLFSAVKRSICRQIHRAVSVEAPAERKNSLRIFQSVT
jgi:hypothetical protein